MQLPQEPHLLGPERPDDVIQGLFDRKSHEILRCPGPCPRASLPSHQVVVHSPISVALGLMSCAVSKVHHGAEDGTVIGGGRDSLIKGKFFANLAYQTNTQTTKVWYLGES